jgi:hypothetical protein
MKIPVALIWGLLLLTGAASAQIVNKSPLSQRITGYAMDVELDPASAVVTGTMDAWWVNTSTDIVPDVQLHMYLNAFRSNKSTFYIESKSSPGTEEKDPGWVEIKSMTGKSGIDLMPSMAYISPDDGNKEDMTVLRIVLPEPAKPGDTVKLKINFRSKLPSRIRRTGFNKDYFFVGQWFPKFGVYEPAGMRYAVKGGWNCHQFHANSEFYANHSVYNVNITVPENYIVGTGGMTLSEEKTANGKKIIRTRAEDIVDYAWTAWPGYAVATDKWNHVKITFLYPPGRKSQLTRQLTAVKNALEYFTMNVGPYPWPHLTFVDPPSIGQGAGGMEYTTIFTSESSDFVPAWMHDPEMVTVHEFGHAYFMGILASNEFEEPWLDEGVNSFWEQRIMDHYYGPDGGMVDLPFFKVRDQSLGRSSYVASGSRQAVSNGEYSWNYPHRTYGMMSYQKTATWLYTMMGIVGEETTNDIFREYYREWAFRHPSGRDFISVVSKVVKEKHGDKFGPDMNWFFDQTAYGTAICDYRVSNFSNSKIRSFEGTRIVEDSIRIEKGLSKNDTIYSSVVELERVGDMMLPVEVLVHFSNGDQITENWDGKSRVKDYKYTGTRKVDWVKIDPEYKITMDVNLINNSMTSKPDAVPVKRISGKLILILEFFTHIISL